MKYIIEKYSTSNSKEPFKINDKKAKEIEQMVNYHYSDEGYKLHSVTPFPDNGNDEDHLVILEEDEDYYNYGSIKFYDNANGKVFYEYNRKGHLDLLQLIKETNSLILETNEGIFNCEFVRSSINIIEDRSFISENLDLYFNIEEID